MEVFSKGNVPSDSDGGWQLWKKHATTRAIRILGAFKVETSEGPLTCQDGYLCIDARGYPYPVAADEFEKIYRPANVKSLGRAFRVLESLKDTEAMVFIRDQLSRNLPRKNLEKFQQHLDWIFGEVYRAGCGDTVDEGKGSATPRPAEPRSQPDESPNKPGAAGPLYDHDTSLEI